MKLRLAMMFGAGFMTAMILGFWPRNAGVACQAGDLAQGLGPTSKGIEDLFGRWIHQARACHVGDYLVVAPVQAGVPDILLSRNGKPFLLASDSVTMVMDEDHVLYDRERGRKLSTTAYNPAHRAWIENVDLNADGTIDWRTTEVAGRAPTHEIRLGDRWLEVVKRNGQNGATLNGQFMSIDEARARLGIADVYGVQGIIKGRSPARP